jgi:hypothetical protein
MPTYIDAIDELKSKEKLKKNFAFAADYHEQQLELDRKGSTKNSPLDSDSRVNKLHPHISSLFAPVLPQVNNITQLKNPAPKEIASLASLILGMEKTAKAPFALPAAQIEPNDEKTAVPAPENLGEEAPVADTNPETVQRQTLWEMWQKAADELEIDLQDLMADPFESNAAQKMMLLCSHLASQMNHESARALLDFIEETRIENLKKAYKPGWKEWTPILLQLFGALAGGFCGFYPAGKGLVGSSAKTWETASSFCNGFLVNGSSSLGQINSTVNQGKHSVVGHELESDKRLQQDLQQRRQQAEQAAKRELENITRMAQQKHETARSINS